MKPKEFLDELKSKGVRVEDGSKHYKLYYKGKQTTCPRHPSLEFSVVFANRIKKQLGLM